MKVERKLYGQIVLILKFLAWDWAKGPLAAARPGLGKSRGLICLDAPEGRNCGPSGPLVWAESARVGLRRI